MKSKFRKLPMHIVLINKLNYKHILKDNRYLIPKIRSSKKKRSTWMLIIFYKIERNHKNKVKKKLAIKLKINKKRSRQVSKTNNQDLSNIKKMSLSITYKNNNLNKNMRTHISKAISKKFKDKENKWMYRNLRININNCSSKAKLSKIIHLINTIFLLRDKTKTLQNS